jgi:hypothetical protein
MYLDSCILVKLLVAEPDSEFFVRSLEGKPLVTSELAQTEVFSAGVDFVVGEGRQRKHGAEGNCEDLAFHGEAPFKWLIWPLQQPLQP